MRSELSLVPMRYCVASEHFCFATSALQMAATFLCCGTVALQIDLIVSTYCACV